MSDSLAHPNFDYASLPLPSQESIRLLSVQHVDCTNETTIETPTEIKLDLVAFTLAGAPSYQAVSYVWGSNTRDRRLTLACRQPLWITENLQVALESVVKHCSTGHLWIGQLCIDQGSLPEKNVQVPLMGKIYSLAYETLIFIAPFESPLLGELIRSYRTCKARLDAQANDTTSPGSKAEDYQAWNPDTYLDHYQAVKVLIEKPWFKRAWVVQEFVLSQRHKFIVAEECLEIDSLSEFVWEFYNLAITAHGLGKFRDIKFHGINNLYGSSDENAEQHL